MHHKWEVTTAAIRGGRARAEHIEANLTLEVVLPLGVLILHRLDGTNLIRVLLNERDHASMLSSRIHLGDFFDFLVKSDGGPRSLHLEIESQLQHFWIRRSHKLERSFVEDEVVLDTLDLHRLSWINLLIHGICDFPRVATHTSTVIYIQLLVGVHGIELLV